MTWNTKTVLKYSNVSATQGPFTLPGGVYGLTAHATWGGGSVTLQRLSADGSTYVNAGTALTADGVVVLQVPSGTFQIAVVTATAAYIDLVGLFEQV